MQKLVEFFQTAPVDPQVAGQMLWLIILLPIIGAFVCGVFGKIIGRANTHLVAVGAVFGSFLLSLIVFWTINDYRAMAMTPFGSVNYAVGFDYGTWFSAGTFKVTFGLFADHLSGSMLLVITGVGFLIHLYSTEYMSHDDGYWRFFAYLNLFVAAMLTLVLGDSLPLLFVGWEGVGMCSYLLIGFWYTDPAKAFAGRKAFITNRIGDFGFLVGSFLLVLLLEGATKLPAENATKLARPGLEGTSVLARLNDGMKQKGPLAVPVLEEGSKVFASILDQQVPSGPLEGHTFGWWLTAALLLFLLGAAGKSAQIPLYVWLPDAMAGPTPVSALIHAATMVTSGIYLFCRISWLAVLSPYAMATIALIGGATALVAALIAFSQKGLKKVLAYSTVSQLGLMFLGIGAGAFWAAFLHVVTHAFFKACLFLGAGSVMHGNGDEEDITKLGNLRKEMPTTWATFLVATLAITGIVPLSGFFSKDAILHAAHVNSIPSLSWALSAAWILGVVTAGCTAFYMMRMYFVAFEYPRSAEAKTPHAHESSWHMTLPLVVLAVLSVVALVHGLPIMKPEGRNTIQTLMENFLDPVFRTTNENLARTGFVKIEPELHVPWGAYLQAWIIALTGGGLAFFLYMRVFPARKGEPLPGPVEALRTASWNKFYVDEVYQFVIIRPLSMVARVLWRVVDSILIDGVAVKGTAWVTKQSGSVLRYLQTGDAQAYAAIMALGLAGALVWILQRYAL
ncbi:MAG: NADH-quinone oxidoreductase subunit L [Myxococcaceae bacterium]|jgi:NADH-quinone oxidoreductase subunit L|nr:NADH-quinone oxidoreductase subunit L [Myxococcaceae bacterium]